MFHSKRRARMVRFNHDSNGLVDFWWTNDTRTILGFASACWNHGTVKLDDVFLALVGKTMVARPFSSKHEITWNRSGYYMECKWAVAQLKCICLPLATLHFGSCAIYMVLGHWVRWVPNHKPPSSTSLVKTTISHIPWNTWGTKGRPMFYPKCWYIYLHLP